MVPCPFWCDHPNYSNTQQHVTAYQIAAHGLRQLVTHAHAGGVRPCSCFLYNLEKLVGRRLCSLPMLACLHVLPLRIGESCQGQTKTPLHRQTRLSTPPPPSILKAAGTRADHLSAFHRPDLYAESVDCRVGLGGAGLGASGDGVLIDVSESALRASAAFSSCRRTCAVLGPYTSSWKCDAQRMQVLATVAT
jgi:hypothetical protein